MRIRSSRRPTLIAIGLAVSCLASCSRHHSVVYTPNTAAPAAPATTSTLFNYRLQPIDMSNHDLEPQGIYDVKHLSFASAGENGQADDMVAGHYFKSRRPGKKALIAVLPIWGSSTYPPNMIAKMIRKQSEGRANVFVMEGKDLIIDWEEIAPVENAEEFTRVSERMVERVRITGVDVRRFLDWAEAQPDVDTERMGLIGFSIGAVVAAAIAPHDPRISSTVLVMGGGRPGEILAYCDGRARKTRNAVIGRLGWTVDEYRERLSHIFRDLDPVQYGAMIDPARVIIIDAERDECIPRSAQDDLWEAMGRPQRISLPYSHRVAFLAMTPLGGNFVREEIWEFLNRTLLEPNPRPPVRRSSTTACCPETRLMPNTD